MKCKVIWNIIKIDAKIVKFLKVLTQSADDYGTGHTAIQLATFLYHTSCAQKCHKATSEEGEGGGGGNANGDLFDLGCFLKCSLFLGISTYDIFV